MARIINSPGVQITEKDLSLRTELPAGTQVVVPGFASQGPTSEPILITSTSELESIYGIPTTPAERYFYYSCKEVLNSPAVLNTIRLPYGAGTGSDYSNLYSALFYPMLSAGTASNAVSAWKIGAPTHYPLSQTEYDQLIQGNFDWTGTSSINVDLSAGEITAGFFILNDLQTVINEGAEGYYVGFVDNLSVSTDSPNFDSIKLAATLSAENGSFAILSSTRLDFALSATKTESDNGLFSVSESLEKVGFIGFETDSYQDHLSLGVFKIRKSTTDATLLTLASYERYLGSFNYNRKQVSPNGGILSNAFIEDAINNGSPTIKAFINPSISQFFNWTVNSTVPTTRIIVQEAAKSLYPIGVYTPDTQAVDTTKVIGSVPGKLDKVLRTLENIEDTTVDVLVDAGLSTIYSTTKQTFSSAEGSFNDATYIDSVSSVNFDLDGSLVDDWRSVVNVLINFSENTRQDCFTIIDLPRSIFISGKDTKVINVDGKTFTANIYNSIKTCLDGIETNYAATYANWVKNTDLFTTRNVWLPFSGYAAAVFARSDASSNTWSAPAGLNRGTFTNVIDIAFNPNSKQRDRLYEIASNPVVLFSGDGFSIFGQKTLQNKPTAFDRINVRRLFLTLERAVRKTLKYFVFEPNTEFTRLRVKNTITPVFDFAKNTEGVYDYLIVVDERNNTQETIDNNEMIVDIYLKPVRTAEFILVNFIATRTGQNFQELI
jgi:hypothetical protein